MASAPPGCHPAGIPEQPSSNAAAYGTLAAVLALPVAVNLWKVIAWGYLPREIWRHFLLDVAVVALLVLVLVTEPLKHPIVYGGLFIALCASYLNAHPPADGWEWFGSIVALALFGGLFPRLHKLTPFVTLGLLISYLAILRLFLPSMSRAEVAEVLAKKRPESTAAELLHATFGYERFFIGLEKLRGFVLRGDGYGARLDALNALHDAMNEQLQSQGMDWLRWNELINVP